MPNDTKKTFRVIIFASFDKEGIVHSYVLNYLQKLKDISSKIIFVADNDANELEKNKLIGLVDFLKFKRHEEYDFGSYKIGWNWLKKQEWFNEVDELVLCNDSCFTVGEIRPVFNEMASINCDFWGMTESLGYKPHYQSFFLVFKKNVINSLVFDEFITSIKKQNSLHDVVVNYEIPIKSLLEENGFIGNAYIKGINCPHQKPLSTLKKNMPLIKKKAFIYPNYNQEGSSLEGIGFLFYKIKHISLTDYKDILSYFKQNSYKMSFLFFLKSILIKLMRFLFKKKVSKNGKISVKICRIPIPIFALNKTKISKYMDQLKYLFKGNIK